MPKDKIRDKLDGNKLDLSLSSLTDIPVKDIATVPKATQLDLSDNQLTSIPDDFCTKLNYLVKIDLSRNHLTSLPENIGSLVKLQHLDLFSNRLTTLPIGFADFQNLRWLDLKDNPLEPAIASVVGECLDASQCKKCANQVVSFMRNIRDEQIRQEEKAAEEKKRKQAKRKARDEREKEKKREEKKAEKERRRQEYLAKQAEEERHAQGDHIDDLNTSGKIENNITDLKPAKRKSGVGCCGVFLAFLVGLVALLVGLYFYCESHTGDKACIEGHRQIRHYTKQAIALWEQYVVHRK